MNYRVDFRDWKTGALAYSATPATSLLNFSFSAQKMASVSYFAFEPMRLKMTFLRDEWLDYAFMSPGLILDRSISKYQVKFYIDNILKFTGLIELSGVDDDDSSEEMSITAYDMLKLYSIYSDIGRVYADEGFSIQQIYWWLNNDIRQALGVRFSEEISYPSSSINIEDKLFYTCDISDLLERVWEMREKYKDSWLPDQFKHALYFTYGTGFKIVYLAWSYDVVTATGGFTNGIHVIGRVWSIDNALCVSRNEEYDIDELIPYEGYYLDAFPYFQTHHPAFQGAITNELVILGRRYYHEYDAYLPDTPLFYGLYDSPSSIDVYYTGQVPTNFTLDNDDSTPINQLAVLKQLMIIRNMTLSCNAEGSIKLRPKSDVGVAVNIKSKHVLSRSRSHIYPETLKAEKFDNLKGDTTALAKVVTDFHAETIKQTLKYTMEIVGDYTINLFDVLRIEGKKFRTLEATPNPLKQSNKVSTWRIYDQNNSNY